MTVMSLLAYPAEPLHVHIDTGHSDGKEERYVNAVYVSFPGQGKVDELKQTE